jgi:peptidoglycan/LPS O-acetylase OafA/YrhL
MGQLSIGKGTPGSVRRFIGGSANGSLWTISVELGFYLVLPLLYGVFVRGRSARAAGVAISTTILLSLALWLWSVAHYANTAGAGWEATPLPWLWLFLIGVVASRGFKRLEPLISGRGLWLLAGYLALTLTILNRGYTGSGLGDDLVHAVDLTLLGVTVISLAYTAPTVAQRLLRHNDLSYGIYLYHFVIIGIALRSIAAPVGWRFAIVAALTVVCAAVSWRFVERPAKRYRSRVLRILEPLMVTRRAPASMDERGRSAAALGDPPSPVEVGSTR